MSIDLAKIDGLVYFCQVGTFFAGYNLLVTIADNEMIKKKERLQNMTDCPITAALEAVGGKWKPHILTTLKDGTLRFGELKRLIHMVSQKALTQQLKELEEAGIVHRQVYAEVPPRVEYSLTPYGQTLRPVLDALYDWGTTHARLYHPGPVPANEPAS